MHMHAYYEHAEDQSGYGCKGSLSGTVKIDGLGQDLSEYHIKQSACGKAQAL